MISVAWLRWVKGFEWAVEAVRQLADAGVPVELTIVGNDPKDDVGEPSERQRILHAVADAGLEEHVRSSRGRRHARWRGGFRDPTSICCPASMRDFQRSCSRRWPPACPSWRLIAEECRKR